METKIEFYGRIQKISKSNPIEDKKQDAKRNFNKEPNKNSAFYKTFNEKYQEEK